MNLKIKDALEKTNITTNKEKSELINCVWKANKNCMHFSTPQFTCKRNISESDKVFIWWNESAYS